MEESQVASIVNITERMLPDARNIYTIGDGNEILELASRLREDLKQLRRVVEDARDAVASQQHQDGGPPKPDVPTLPSMNPQAWGSMGGDDPTLGNLLLLASQVRGMLGLPEPPAAAASVASPAQPPQTTQLAGSAAPAPLYHYPMPPYPPSMHSSPDSANLLAQLYPLTLAAAAAAGMGQSPFPPTPATATAAAAPSPQESTGKKTEDVVIIIDD